MYLFKAIILIVLASHLYAGEKADFEVVPSKDKTAFSYMVKPPKNNSLTLDVAIDPVYLKEPDKDVGIDILLLIDNTGSMGHIIEMIKTQIDDISSFLLANYPNVHIAISSISEHSLRNSHDSYRIVQDFTHDPAVIKSNIADLRLDNETNNDYPEPYLYGLSRSLELGWRDDSQKILFFIGDAWGHEPDPGPDKTLNTADDLYTESVLDIYKDKQIQICSYYVDVHNDVKNFFTTFSDQTNGFLKPIKKDSNVKNDFQVVLHSLVGLSYNVNAPFDAGAKVLQKDNHFLFDFDLKEIALSEHKRIKVLFAHNNANIGKITISLVPGRPWGMLVLIALLLFVLAAFIALRFIYRNVYTTTIMDFAYLRHYAVLLFASLCYGGIVYLVWMQIDTPGFPIIWDKLWW